MSQKPQDQVKINPIVGHTLNVWGNKFGVWDFFGSLTPLFVERDLNQTPDIFSYLTDPKLIIDLGAHVGVWTFALKKKFPECLVKAYEPNPNAAKFLYEACILNEVKHVEIHQRAVSNSKQIPMHCDPTNTGSNSEFLSRLTDRETIYESCVADCIPLSEVVTSEVDLLKVDIEGGEFQIFQDFEKWDLIKSMYIEIHAGLFTKDIKEQVEMTNALKNFLMSKMVDKRIIFKSDVDHVEEK